MINLPAFKPRNLHRYPRLDTMLMIESALFKYKNYKTLNWIWNKLPKKVMWTTFTTIVDYLEYSGKIRVEKDKTIAWLWDPKGVRKILKNKKLIVK
jgi:ribosomal protein L24E